MFKKVINKVKGAGRALLTSRAAMAVCMAMCSMGAFAQNAAGNYEAGTNALTTVATEIAKYVPIVVKLCYAIAGVVAIVGAISVYIAMNNDEQDVKEFMGIQGRYIYWAAATCGAAILGFIIGYCIMSFLAGLIILVVSLGVGAALVMIKQRRGLHSKKTDNGVFIYSRSTNL